jgi:hypothetical protein
VSSDEFEDNVIDTLSNVLLVVHRLFYENTALFHSAVQRNANATTSVASDSAALSAPTTTTTTSSASSSSSSSSSFPSPSPLASQPQAVTYGHHPSVPTLLDGLKSTVLGGVHVLFSSVYPQHHPQPHTTEPWKLAVSFGALFCAFPYLCFFCSVCAYTLLALCRCCGA